MSLFPGEVGPCIYPWGHRSQTESLRALRGGVGYLSTEEASEYLFKKKKVEWTRTRDNILGEREENK